MNNLFSRRAVPLAWAQLAHQKVRTSIAMGGIAFANVLIFMQLGFVNLFAGGAILLPKHLQGDLFLINPDALFIGADTFDRTRLYQAAAFDGIIAAEPLYMRRGIWALNKKNNFLRYADICLQSPTPNLRSARSQSPTISTSRTIYRVIRSIISCRIRADSRSTSDQTDNHGDVK